MCIIIEADIMLFVRLHYLQRPGAINQRAVLTRLVFLRNLYGYDVRAALFPLSVLVLLLPMVVNASPPTTRVHVFQNINLLIMNLIQMIYDPP